MSRRTRSISPDVEEPAVLLALGVREVEAWPRDGSNQASSGHVELSDSDIYDMEEEEHEMDALSDPGLAVAKLWSRLARFVPLNLYPRGRAAINHT